MVGCCSLFVVASDLSGIPIRLQFGLLLSALLLLRRETCCIEAFLTEETEPGEIDLTQFNYSEMDDLKIESDDDSMNKE